LIRVFFIIRSLERGGRERQLYELLRRIDKDRFEPSLITLYDGGSMRRQFESIPNLKLFSLGKKSRWDVGVLWRLRRLITSIRPQLLVGCLTQGNLTSVLVGKCAGTKVAWIVAHGAIANQWDLGWLWVISFRVCTFLSTFADLIITNSRNGYQYCISEGYCARRMVKIPNGTDTSYFKPDRNAGHLLRRDWEISDGTTLIGLVAGADPRKDHATFLKAAVILMKIGADVRFVCVGCTPDEISREAQGLASSPLLRERVKWPGKLRNMPQLYAALDIFTLSSTSEGSSNALAEAMACGVPCVVTNAGDAAEMAGPIWPTIAPGDPAGLAGGWQRIMDMLPSERDRLRRLSRERIISGFGVEKMVDKTSQALLNLVDDDTQISNLRETYTAGLTSAQRDRMRKPSV
jgi:glycosyltransferase involved in cell wall biosynthesis